MSLRPAVAGPRWAGPSCLLLVTFCLWGVLAQLDGMPPFPQYEEAPPRPVTELSPGKLPANAAQSVSLTGRLATVSLHTRPTYDLLLNDGNGTIVMLPQQPAYANGALAVPGDLLSVVCDVLLPSKHLTKECIGLSVATFLETKVPMPIKTSATGETTTNFAVKFLVVRLTTTCSGRSQPRSESTLRATWQAVSDELGACSYGSMTMPKTSIRVISVELNDCTAYTSCDYTTMATKGWTLAKSALGTTASQYTHWALVLPTSGCDNYFAALAYIGSGYDAWLGRPATTWYTPGDYGAGRVSTIMQEVLHNFGLYHSSTDSVADDLCACHYYGTSCDSCHSEYGDYSTCMGWGDFCPSAAEAYRLGWTQALGVLQTSNTAVGQVYSFNVPALQRSTSNVVIVKPDWAGSNYFFNMYFSTRDNSGGDAGMYTDFMGRVNVHTVSKTVDVQNTNDQGDMHLISLIPASTRKVFTKQKLVVYTGAVAADKSIPVSFCTYSSSSSQCPNTVDPQPSPPTVASPSPSPPIMSPSPSPVQTSPRPPPSPVLTSPRPSPSPPIPTLRSPPPSPAYEAPQGYEYPPALIYPPYDYYPPPSEEVHPPPSPPPPSPPPSPPPPSPPPPSPPPPSPPPPSSGNPTYSTTSFLPISSKSPTSLTPLSVTSVQTMELVDSLCKMGGKDVGGKSPGIDCRVFKGSSIGKLEQSGPTLVYWLVAAPYGSSLYISLVRIDRVGSIPKAYLVSAKKTTITESRTLATFDSAYINGRWLTGSKWRTTTAFTGAGIGIATLSYRVASQFSVAQFIGIVKSPTKLPGTTSTGHAQVLLTAEGCFLGGAEVNTIAPGSPCTPYRGNQIAFKSSSTVAPWIAAYHDSSANKLFMVNVNIQVVSGDVRAHVGTVGVATFSGDASVLTDDQINLMFKTMKKLAYSSWFTRAGLGLASVGYQQASGYFSVPNVFLGSAAKTGLFLAGIDSLDPQAVTLTDTTCYLGGVSVSKVAPGNPCRMFKSSASSSAQTWLAINVNVKNNFYITQVTVLPYAGKLVAYASAARWNTKANVKLETMTGTQAATLWSRGKNARVATSFSAKDFGLAGISYTPVEVNPPPCTPLSRAQCVNLLIGDGYNIKNVLSSNADANIQTADDCANFCQVTNNNTPASFSYSFSEVTSVCSCAQGPDVQVLSPGVSTYMHIC